MKDKSPKEIEDEQIEAGNDEAKNLILIPIRAWVIILLMGLLGVTLRAASNPISNAELYINFCHLAFIFGVTICLVNSYHLDMKWVRYAVVLTYIQCFVG